MISTGDNVQSCAACRYQRRRCTTECLLAPYFPVDRTTTYMNAHKLFGVNNIKKILRHLSLDQRIIAATTIKYVANMWAMYPVNGPLVEIAILDHQIRRAEAELETTRAKLAHYKEQRQLQYMSHDTHNTDPLHAAATLFPVTRHVSYSGENSSGAEEINAVNSLLWLQQMKSSDSNNYNTSSTTMQSEWTTSQPMSIQQETTQDLVEMHQFLDGIDDNKSCIGSKIMYESSMELSSKYSRQAINQMLEKELKKAAACFTLGRDEKKQMGIHT